MEKRFSEKVIEQISQRPVKIMFPADVFQEFSDYAKKETADCYWLAIKQLLDHYKSTQGKEVAYRLLDEKINTLAFALESHIDETTPKDVVVSEKKVKRSFGD